MESAYQTSKLEKLLHRTIAGLFALSAVCFMIYTTELHYAHAEGEEDLGSASSPINASVTVGTACNFSGNVDIPHTSTIMNGINSTDIGKTTMNVTCNDEGGYAVYAIGYTNDEYGNTTLQSSISDDYNISTGTSTSGNTSNWSMKLSTVPGTTTATIENGYNNYSTVPDDYTKVATLNTITNPGTSTTGSSISTTYQTYISPTQPAGTYTGKVKYTLVHPSTAPKPEIPVTIDDLTYMQEFAALSTDDKASVLNSMAEEQQYQLKDSRDQKDYYISKLKDGNIWMTQNLDLDLNRETPLNPTDTDVTAEWRPQSTITSVGNWVTNNYTPSSFNPGIKYYYASGTTTYDSQYTSLAACQAEHPDCSTHNHAGNYYNWSAAIASKYSNTTELTTKYNNAPESICPAGWRLPKVTGSDTTITGSEFSSMLVAEGIIANPTDTSYTADGFNKIRTAPLWLTQSGHVDYGSLYSGTFGFYWSSTVFNSGRAFALEFNSDHIIIDGLSRNYGFSIRCLVK